MTINDVVATTSKNSKKILSQSFRFRLKNFVKKIKKKINLFSKICRKSFVTIVKNLIIIVLIVLNFAKRKKIKIVRRKFCVDDSKFKIKRSIYLNDCIYDNFRIDCQIEKFFEFKNMSKLFNSKINETT